MCTINGTTFRAPPCILGGRIIGIVLTPNISVLCRVLYCVIIDGIFY